MKFLNAQKVKENVERRMAEDQADGRVGGSGVCVMQNGQLIYKNYFGKKSYAEGGESMADIDGDKVIFRLASMTKPITTVAVLIQVARGLLELDTPVSKWLPAFGEMNVGRMNAEGKVEIVGKAQHPLTLRILLNHTNGMGDVVGGAEFGRITKEQRANLAGVADFLATAALAFEPTTREAYSGTQAFDVAARCVELTSGKPFDVFVKENIFDPCGMVDTTFAPTDEQWTRMITMHNRTEDGRSVDARTYPGCVFEDFATTWFSGGAGLAATMPDYVKFAEMLCRGGVTENGTRILPAELVKEMGTPTVPESVMPGPQKWGIGVRVIDSDSYQMPNHCFGWSGAYGTHYWVDPDNQITAVYMKNSRYDGGSGARTAFLFEQDVYGAFEE